VPRVAHPDWVYKRLRERNDPARQKSLRDMFAPAPAPGDEAGPADAMDGARGRRGVSSD
jgi:DNA polymerase epsilon subunit 1